ncbi:tannase/feruloyl esterase family alpha/beta hydrolase [Altererythrobacter lauratis]|uniref:Tannase/feruloyl esterase family alpha/beta hydrolase n=1 Tax=Alteraurantiacibacter lauratis TaxID=2054627 RepID=A0ABV7EE89_9SPHN
MRHRVRGAAVLACSVSAFGLGSALPAQETQTVPAERCGRAMMQLGDGYLEVTAATLIPAQPATMTPFGPQAALPQHCLVEGMLNRRTGVDGKEYGIGFELALPLTWNGRYLLMGGGGLNGSIRPPFGPVAAGNSNALAMGFAVASHDSGHKGEVFDASFQADQRAALDFAETSVHTVTLATRWLAAAFYGEPPRRSYMTGCSTGGREGMLASQRYPELFDGIVIGAPAMRPGHSNLAIEWAQVLLNRTQAAGVTTPAGFSSAERAVVDAGLARQCDGADGRVDGMIFNVEACRNFDARALACAPGQVTDGSAGCLAPEKAEALAQIFAGPREASGRPLYTAIPWDTGVTYAGPGLPGYIPSGAPGPFGPANAGREIDLDARLAAVEWDAVGRLTDTAYWTNLSTFLRRGAKIMFYHGVSDPWFSAIDTWEYFQRAREANGAAAWDDAARFYMVPGMLHCSGGNAFDRFDLLSPLVEWVEQGRAPNGITARRSDGAAGERPLCAHPAYPHYTGGDPALAASYSCRLPQG